MIPCGKIDIKKASCGNRRRATGKRSAPSVVGSKEGRLELDAAGGFSHALKYRTNAITARSQAKKSYLFMGSAPFQGQD